MRVAAPRLFRPILIDNSPTACQFRDRLAPAVRVGGCGGAPRGNLSNLDEAKRSIS